MKIDEKVFFLQNRKNDQTILHLVAFCGGRHTAGSVGAGGRGEGGGDARVAQR